MIETRETGPRPKGTDYDIPDREDLRCKVCNPTGLNRTGLKPIGVYVGRTTDCMYAIPCPNRCKDGLIKLWDGMG